MKYIKIVIIFVFVSFLLYLGFKDVSFSKMIDALGGVSISAVIIFSIGTFSQFFIRAYRWGILLRPYKKNIPIMTLYNFTVIGYMLNLFPGKVGELAKAFMLAKQEKIDKGIGLGSVFLERLIDFLTIVLIFLVSLLLIPEIKSDFLIGLKANSFIFLIIVFIIFCVLFLLNNKSFFAFVEKIISFFSKLIPKKYREGTRLFLIDFAKGIRLKLGFSDTIKLILSSILVWIYLIPFYWILLKGFNIDISIAKTTTHLSVLVSSAAIPTPGMAGTFDAFSIRSLVEILKPANVVDVAAAYTIVLHVVVLASQIIAGSIAFKMQKLDLSILDKLRKEK